MNQKIIASAVAMVLFVIIAVIGVKQFALDEASEPYEYKEKLFVEDAVATVNITMDEEDWADMLENPLDEQYKEASVTINGETVHNVAVRTKGNSSLSMVASSDSDRYSLKVDFDHYDNTQSFYGLRTLNLNNNISDSSQMRDFVSYEMFEQLGITVPAHSYMNVTINDEPYGLLLGVENIDATYIANNYKTNAGYLFKPDGVGSDLQYISDDLDDYEGVEVKMNEDTVQHSQFLSFIEAINNGENIEAYVDVDEMLRYFAMNTALVSLDSYQGQMKHNYYLYENEDGVMSILPWDYNMAFGGFGIDMGGMPGGAGNATENEETTSENTENENVRATTAAQNTGDFSTPPSGDMPNGAIPPSMNAETDDAANVNPANMPNGATPTSMNAEIDDETDDASNDGARNMPNIGGGMSMMSSNLMSESAINFSISAPVAGTTLEERPLLNVLLSNNDYRATYEAYLNEIATTIFTEQNVLAITTKLETLLADYVEADPSKFYTTEAFHENVKGENSLPAFAAARSASILAQLNGETVTTSDATATTTNSAMQAPPSDIDNAMPNFNIEEMSDEAFQQFIATIPLSFPDDFETQSIEEQRKTVSELLKTSMPGNENMPSDAPNMGDDAQAKGGNFSGRAPGNMANRSDEGELNEDPMKTMYQYGFFLALAAIALLLVRNLRRR